MSLVFFLFFLSGFAGLVYETVWLRLTMARFGVTAISLAIVVSVFMAGLALGSWLVARLRSWLQGRAPRTAMRLYGGVELAIALTALLVPPLLALAGRWTSLGLHGHNAWLWYAAELVELTVILLLPCTAMGMTIPMALHALESLRSGDRRANFSYLYLANVLGAVVGTLLAAFVLIELYGFHHTLWFATAANLATAGLAVLLAGWRFPAQPVETGPAAAASSVPLEMAERLAPLVALFFTGLVGMGLEVIWTRLYTTFVGTVVYSFAAILAAYLIFTFLGSAVYRAVRPAKSSLQPWVWFTLAVVASLPLLATDWVHFTQLQRYSLWAPITLKPDAMLRVALGVGPVSFILGFVTPHLLDRWSQGRSDRTGIAYAVNTVGCILGPLLVGFVFLPHMSERTCLVLLCLPFLGIALFGCASAAVQRYSWAAAGLAVVCLVAFNTGGLEDVLPGAHVLRDDTATTIAWGEGMDKQLAVNGVGMTSLVPVTKVMAHLPLAVLGNKAHQVLVICFGMGTTFRSATTWGIPTTVVDLVPSVPRFFPFFHPDAPQVLARPGVQVRVDDGRRFLEASNQKYDLIITDPPPPMQAAASSLLYSREFDQQVLAHLSEDGIFAQWIPWTPSDDPTILEAAVRSLQEVFPYVRGFVGINSGLHLFATRHPVVIPDPTALAKAMPPAAAADFVEWGPRNNPEQQFAVVTSREVRLPPFNRVTSDVPALSDDRPINEYYFLRTDFSVGPRSQPSAWPRPGPG